MEQEQEDALIAKSRTRGKRQAVSDKSYNPEDARNRPRKVIAKSDEDRTRLEAIFKSSFLFRHLTTSSMNELIDAMFVKDFSEGDVIITQGDKGDFFYVIERGECSISVEGKGKVMDCKPGDSFGELALMYNSPRAATVVAASDVRCWAVDRITFKTTLLSHTIKKRDMYEAFLKEVPLLAHLSDYERLSLADSLTPEKFSAEETVVTQGDQGNKFYIVESGELDIVKDGVNLGSLGSGEYFGELALLNDEPRAATIVAASPEVVVLALDRRTFDNGLMKTTHGLLKQNAAKYAKSPSLSPQKSLKLLDADGDSDDD